MPVVIPTPDELQRMSWHQRQRAIRTTLGSWPRADYAQPRLREPWEDPDHPDWVDDTLRKARELLGELPVDPQAAHRLELWTTCRRRTTVSALHPQASLTVSESSCGQVESPVIPRDSVADATLIVAS